MPLREDHNYRGPYALHVRNHSKLAGKHRTLTRESFNLINGLVDDARISSVQFGRVAGSQKGGFTPRCEIAIDEGTRNMRVVLIGRHSGQWFKVRCKTVDLVPEVAAHIKKEWAAQFK